ncbi:hypothetical protein CDAR_172241 [Caerostris darwini]|uniref:Uncharacterized protein n=1 Tax=Caerostris darwini TaxID=1538125 RepID=A0AAV4U3H4_9ARAC|nr:hypothetical protein CDAR_172241 [Caerostris darwini]
MNKKAVDSVSPRSRFRRVLEAVKLIRDENQNPPTMLFPNDSVSLPVDSFHGRVFAHFASTVARRKQTTMSFRLHTSSCRCVALMEPVPLKPLQ